MNKVIEYKVGKKWYTFVFDGEVRVRDGPGRPSVVNKELKSRP